MIFRGCWFFFCFFFKILKPTSQQLLFLVCILKGSVFYLYDISSRCSRCTLPTGVGHRRVDGWRGELLLVHARIGNLGPMLSLDHGLRGPGRHLLGLRVGSQRGHDGCSDGGRGGVVLQDWLSDDSVD